jgi:hypothetical protein
MERRTIVIVCDGPHEGDVEAAKRIRLNVVGNRVIHADLCNDCLEAMLKYVANSTTAARAHKPSGSSRDGIRKWAEENGFTDVPRFGRVPQVVIDAWDEAHAPKGKRKAAAGK